MREAAFSMAAFSSGARRREARSTMRGIDEAKESRRASCLTMSSENENKSTTRTLALVPDSASFKIFQSMKPDDLACLFHIHQQKPGEVGIRAEDNDAVL